MENIKAVLVSAHYPNEYYLWTPWNKAANMAISKLNYIKTEIIAPLPFSLPVKYFPYNKLSNIPPMEYGEEGKIHRPRFMYLLPQRLFYGITGEFYRKSISKYIFKNLTEIDMVHSHQAYPDGYGMVDVCEKWSIPLITEIHSTNTLNIWSNNRSVRKKFFKTLNSSERIICISKELCDSVREFGIPDEKIVYIPLGVDTDLFKPLNVKNTEFELKISNEKILIFVGRLIKLKNIDQILKAVSKLAVLYKDFKLLIVGDGPEKGGLLKLAKDLNLCNHVKFLGELKGEELAYIYSLADILILASSTEGRPMVIYEGMASECAVIATDVGGVHEQIKENYNGFLFKPNDVDGLISKIRCLLENDEILKKMKENSRKRVIDKNWTWDGYAKLIDNVYGQVSK